MRTEVVVAACGRVSIAQKLKSMDVISHLLSFSHSQTKKDISSSRCTSYFSSL
ncbi:hypothetical protein PGB90_004745 [Kerria lacca]